MSSRRIAAKTMERPPQPDPNPQCPLCSARALRTLRLRGNPDAKTGFTRRREDAKWGNVERGLRGRRPRWQAAARDRSSAAAMTRTPNPHLLCEGLCALCDSAAIRIQRPVSREDAKTRSGKRRRGLRGRRPARTDRCIWSNVHRIPARRPTVRATRRRHRFDLLAECERQVVRWPPPHLGIHRGGRLFESALEPAGAATAAPKFLMRNLLDRPHGSATAGQTPYHFLTGEPAMNRPRRPGRPV